MDLVLSSGGTVPFHLFTKALFCSPLIWSVKGLPLPGIFVTSRGDVGVVLGRIITKTTDNLSEQSLDLFAQDG